MSRARLRQRRVGISLVGESQRDAGTPADHALVGPLTLPHRT
jgi:hypothetical protein